MRQKLSINLRYRYSSRRATQNMSATRNSPTIGINLRALPLSALTVLLHYLPRCLRSNNGYQGCQPVFTKKARPCPKKSQIAVLKHIHIKNA